jgi:nucleotidyltransferase substrate binding protein (TIGR01987 family)
MTQENTSRWLYRFDNFKRAFNLLQEAITTLDARALSSLEKEGVIQRFEYTWELGWKTLKDYLDHTGTVLDTITPAAVIRAAFAAKLIGEGELWMQALDARNKMSHTYNHEAFEKIITDIHQHYFALLKNMHNKMLELEAQEKARG